MEKKYEITNETHPNNSSLKRIKSLKYFNGIQKGDLGGFVEKESNLSHEGDCWVFGDAKVCGDAKVFGNAVVSGNARVFGDAKVCGDAKVFGNAVVSGDANVFGNARVFGNAEVFENAKVCGDAKVFGNAVVSGNARVFGNATLRNKVKTTNKVKSFILSNHVIAIEGNYLNIGCISLTVNQWLEQYKELGNKNGYSEDEIEEYGNVIKMIKMMYFK